MCEPTPVSTVFETSSITRYQTATSSTPILHTPTPSVSIIVQSSCARFRETPNPNPLPSSLTTSSLPTESSNRWWKGEWGQDDAARRTSDRQDGVDDWRNGRDATEMRVATSIAAIALNVEKTGSTIDFVSSRSREERAKTRTKSYKTKLSASTTISESQASSSSLWRDTSVGVGETATTKEERDRGRHRIANTGNFDQTSVVEASSPTTTVHRGGHRFVHRQECEEWVTTTLTSTVSFPAETSWSTVEVVKTDIVVTSHPVETIFASCPVTTATSISSAGVVNAIQTEESPSPSSVISSLSDISSLETSSGPEIPSTSEFSAVPTVSSISSSSMAATTRQFSSLSLKPLPYPTASPKPLANANDPIDPPISLSTTSASQSAAPANEHTESSSMSKGATAGAVIGGILALLLLLALVLVTIRYIMKKKRQDRTRELRSSWFYDGDITDPAADEKNRSQSEPRFSHLQSRFSAPSFSSRDSKYAMPLPGFLALPIKHVRAASGRLPDVFNNFRQSVQQHSGFAPMNASTRVGTNHRTNPSYANAANAPLRVPPLPPHVAEVTPIGAFPAPPHRSVHDPPPTGRSNGSDRMETMIPSPSSPPRISLNGLGESDFGWTDSRGSPRILADSLPSEYSQFDPLPGMRKHGLHIVNGPPAESYYSVYSNLSAPHSELLSYDSRQIGQAISAPGRESIELAQNPGILIRPSSGARNLVPVPTAVPDNLTAPLAPLYGLSTPRSSAAGHSSLFEYSDYDPRRASHMTHASATTRATRNWYEQSLYGDSGQQGELADRASRSSFVSGIWTMHGDGNDESHRKSRSKSVRWRDEEPMPKITNGRHAL